MENIKVNYYKEQLEKAKKYDIDWLSLSIANEVQDYFEVEEITLNEEEFENVCHFIVKRYLNSEYSNISNYVKAMASIIEREKEENANISIDEIIDKTSRWDLLYLARDYD